MSMSGEELEKTGLLKKMLEKAENDEMTIGEEIEEFEERIDYINIDSDKKEKLKELCDEIKKEEDEKTKEFLFKQLVKLANEN